MKLKYNQVDVFTSVPYKGNPVGVCFDADELTPSVMQQIANWTNLSETTFVQSSAVGDYKLRIFTPKNELKFAGHPTVGSAFALLDSGRLNIEKKEFVQECKAGLVKIKNHHDTIYAKVPGITPLESEVDCTKLEEAIGCPITSRPIAVDTGPIWLTFSVAGVHLLNNICIDVDKTRILSRQVGVSGLNIYCIDEKRAVHLRTFAPILGIQEDPVCGSGNAAVAAHIKISGKAETVGQQYTAYQGSAMGRSGVVQVVYDENDIYIGGNAVVVINGTIAVEE
jgi:PhzF family phenazine biosynthesis protein